MSVSRRPLCSGQLFSVAWTAACDLRGIPLHGCFIHNSSVGWEHTWNASKYIYRFERWRGECRERETLKKGRRARESDGGEKTKREGGREGGMRVSSRLFVLQRRHSGSRWTEAEQEQNAHQYLLACAHIAHQDWGGRGGGRGGGGGKSWARLRLKDL